MSPATDWTFRISFSSPEDDNGTITVYEYGNGRVTMRFESLTGHPVPLIIEVLDSAQIEELRATIEQVQHADKCGREAILALLRCAAHA